MARSAVLSPQSVSTSSRTRQSTTAPTPARASHASRAPSRATPSVSRGTPGPSSTAASVQTNPNALPPYQPSSLPLNPRGIDALGTLLRSNGYFRDLNNHLKEAYRIILQAAGDINECVTFQTEENTKRQKKRQRDDAGEEDEDENAREAEAEQKLQKLRKTVGDMTGRMDAQVRKMIDGYAGLDALEKSVEDLQKKANDAVAAAAGDLASQTQTNTQFTTQPNSDGEETPGAPSLAPTLTDSLTNRMDKYTSQTLTTRYTTHNDYVGFKRLVHDSHYPAGKVAPPLPARTTWFQREEGRGSPAPGETGAEPDSDDDIAISRENISTRCPLTLKDFEDPVTSTKCPHSYERTAILEVIASAPRMPPHARAQLSERVQKVRCPVPGCEHMLGKDDLVHDAVLVRKIKRMLAAKEREREEMLREAEEEGGDGARVEEIESGSEGDDGEDIDELERREGLRRGRTPAASAKIKAEIVRRRARDEIEDD